MHRVCYVLQQKGEREKLSTEANCFSDDDRRLRKSASARERGGKKDNKTIANQLVSAQKYISLVLLENDDDPAREDGMFLQVIEFARHVCLWNCVSLQYFPLLWLGCPRFSQSSIFYGISPMLQLDLSGKTLKKEIELSGNSKLRGKLCFNWSSFSNNKNEKENIEDNLQHSKRQRRGRISSDCNWKPQSIDGHLNQQSEKEKKKIYRWNWIGNFSIFIHRNWYAFWSWGRQNWRLIKLVIVARCAIEFDFTWTPRFALLCRSWVTITWKCSTHNSMLLLKLARSQQSACASTT